LGGSVHTIQRNTETCVVAIKGVRLEVNGDKTKFTVISEDQNAGRSHNIKIDNTVYPLKWWNSSNI
jgi:hypothetical protein